MDAPTILVFLLNGLVLGFTVFLIAAGLTLVFGVLRVLNFAHGGFFMLGTFLAWQLGVWWGNFWLALLLVPVILAVVGGGIEILLLRRVYRLHITFQLLLTFAIFMIIADGVRLIWGGQWKGGISEPQVLAGSVNLLGSQYPVYNLFYILIGMVVAFILWYFLNRVRYGKVISAARSDREVAATLGRNVPVIYTAVFALGAFLAGIAGVIYAPSHSITLDLGSKFIVLALAVVVVGGLGSIRGALIGSIAVGEIIAFSAPFFQGYEVFFIFLLIAGVLILKPYGLFGEKAFLSSEYWARGWTAGSFLYKPLKFGFSSLNATVLAFLFVLLLLIPPIFLSEFYLLFLTELLIVVIFALSLNLLLGYTGLLSLGHGGFFAIGAYSSALVLTQAKTAIAGGGGCCGGTALMLSPLQIAQALPPLVFSILSASLASAMVAVAVGYISLRLEEIYFAMFTLAFGMLVNGLLYKWKAVVLNVPRPGLDFFAPNLSPNEGYYIFTLIVFTASVLILWLVANSPFGMTLRSIRENPKRSRFIGLDIRAVRLRAFVVSAFFSGLAGGLFAPFLGSVNYNLAFWTKSMEPVLMSLLGGINSFLGPAVGATIFMLMKEVISSELLDYWMLYLGILLVLLVLFLPGGVVEISRKLKERGWQSGRNSEN